MTEGSARRPSVNAVWEQYEQSLADRPGFYAISLAIEGVVVRATNDFKAVWAEEVVPDRPITLIRVPLAMVEMRNRLEVALAIVDQTIGPHVVVVGTYSDVEQQLFKIRVEGGTDVDIQSLNIAVDDPRVICEDAHWLPRRYGFKSRPDNGILAVG